MTGLRVHLTGHGDRQGIRASAERAAAFLAGRAGVRLVGMDLTGQEDLSRVEADLLVVLGGDGTILGAARRMGANQIPTLGINTGRLGFLSNFVVEDLESALERAVGGVLAEERRLMLACVHLPRGSPTPAWESRALNDGVLGRLRASAMVDVDVRVGGTLVSTFSGDGVVVSTPCGSTAYCLSAGGPILAPGLECLVVVPLACHTMALRPLVIPAARGVSLTLRTEGRSGPACFVVDGQETLDIQPGDRIDLTAAPEQFRILMDPEVGFFEVLRAKLGLAGHPNYRW